MTIKFGKLPSFRSKQSRWREEYDKLQKLIIENDGDLELMAYQESVQPAAIYARLRTYNLVSECTRYRQEASKEVFEKCTYVLPLNEQTPFDSEEALYD